MQVPVKMCIFQRVVNVHFYGAKIKIKSNGQKQQNATNYTGETQRQLKNMHKTLLNEIEKTKTNKK